MALPGLPVAGQLRFPPSLLFRLQAYPEGTAGAVMTTEVARLPESLTVRQALEALSKIAENLETIYYIYIVDDDDIFVFQVLYDVLI